MLCCRMVVAIGYYGLSLSVTSLAGNKYLNLFISGALEMPAYIAAVFILNRWVNQKYVLKQFTFSAQRRIST